MIQGKNEGGKIISKQQESILVKQVGTYCIDYQTIILNPFYCFSVQNRSSISKAFSEDPAIISFTKCPYLLDWYLTCCDWSVSSPILLLCLRITRVRSSKGWSRQNITGYGFSFSNTLNQYLDPDPNPHNFRPVHSDQDPLFNADPGPGPQ